MKVNIIIIKNLFKLDYSHDFIKMLKTITSIKLSKNRLGILQTYAKYFHCSINRQNVIDQAEIFGSGSKFVDLDSDKRKFKPKKNTVVKKSKVNYDLDIEGPDQSDIFGTISNEYKTM